MLVGACVGAVVGGVYAVVLVTYRDMLATQRAGVGPERKPCGPCEEAKRRNLGESPELSDAERERENVARADFHSTADKAREIRAQHPEMRWQDAMREAAAIRNGAAPEQATEATE